MKPLYLLEGYLQEKSIVKEGNETDDLLQMINQLKKAFFGGGETDVDKLQDQVRQLQKKVSRYKTLGIISAATAASLGVVLANMYNKSKRMEKLNKGYE